VAHQTTRFIAVYGLAFMLNYGLSSGFYTLGFHAFMGSVVFGVSIQRQHVAYLAKALAIGCTAVWNYFFSHYFIFRRHPVPIAADAAGLL
jgi:putative flippase GtrA